MRCNGACGRIIDSDEHVVEINRAEVYCIGCAIVAPASNLMRMREEDLTPEQLSLV